MLTLKGLLSRYQARKVIKAGDLNNALSSFEVNYQSSLYAVWNRM